MHFVSFYSKFSYFREEAGGEVNLGKLEIEGVHPDWYESLILSDRPQFSTLDFRPKHGPSFIQLTSSDHNVILNSDSGSHAKKEFLI